LPLTSNLTAYRSPGACAPPAVLPLPEQDFPPEGLAATHEPAIEEILAEPLDGRRLRANPRVIKRKMSGWPVKRPEHRQWPQPSRPAKETIEILAA
jgi:hypothetical protein